MDRAAGTISNTFRNLRVTYLQTLSDVYDSFLVDGEDIMPDITRALTINYAEGSSSGDPLINESFRKVYNSGFYPWPGYPEIPDSLDTTKDELFG